MTSLNFFFICCTLVSLIFTFNIKRISEIINIYDKPSKIKIHSNPIPPIGGILIFLLLLIIYGYLLLSEINKDNFFLGYKFFINFFLVSFLFFSMGLLDDKYNYRPSQKVAFMLFLILFSVFIDENLLIKNIKFANLENDFDLKNFSYFFTVLCFFAFINAFNMIDGVNYQCILYSILLLVFLSFFKDLNLVTFPLLIGLVAILFLNHKNKIFLGNSGTYMLAYIFAYLFTRLYNFKYITTVDYIILLFYLPIIELVRLCIFRILNNQNPFAGDNNHLHHILIKKNNIYISQIIYFSIIILMFISYAIFKFLPYSLLIGTIYYSLILFTFKYCKFIKF